MKRKVKTFIAFRGTQLAALGAILLLSGPCRAAIRYVNKNAAGATHDGTTWATAFLTVQQGVNAALSGDDVWVTKGTYVATITLKSGVGVYGGFVGTETDRVQRDAVANVTILDGNLSGSVVTCPPGAVITTVLDGFTLRNGTGTDDGDYINGTSFRGAGIHCVNASPTISHNTLSGNQADYSDTVSYGGGIYVRSSAAVITGNTFTGNGADAGGGIRAETFNGTISDNVFTSNSATDYGGGMDLVAASAITVSGNRFTSNTSGGYGGGLRMLDSNAIFVNNTLTRNVAPDGAGLLVTKPAGAVSTGGTVSQNTFDANNADYPNTDHGGGAGVMVNITAPKIDHNVFTGNHGNYGAAVYVWNGSASHIVDNLMANNTSKYEGGGIECDNARPLVYNNTMVGNTAPNGVIWAANGAGPTLVNNLLAFNSTGLWKDAATSATLRNNDVFGNTAYNYTGVADPTGTNGNTEQDPLFVNRASGDYHLQLGSPCIDKGDDSIVAVGETDLDAKPRVFGPHVDMGAYENSAATPLPYTITEVANALMLSGGLTAAGADDLKRLNTEASGASAGLIDIADALRLARKVAGLEQNP